ncbi:MAG: response regulator [Myxococcota bacterium]
MASRARILAIDDQLYFRSLIEGLLSEEGYRVETAPGYPSALALLEREGPFDVVLMDLVAPGGAGAEQVAELRRRYPDQDVIVLTGRKEGDSVVSALRQGAVGCLEKPLERESLVQSIATVLQSRRLRTEHERLVGENLEMLARLSQLERAVAMLDVKRPGDIGRTLLELIATETRAGQGTVWLRQRPSGPLVRTALRGRVDLETTPLEWTAPDRKVEELLGEGRALLASGDRKALLLPCSHEGELLAVVRLSEPAGGIFSGARLVACEKLAAIGALAIANSLELHELRQTSFRDTLSGLPTRPYLEMVAETEIHKAHRYGRRLSFYCIELGSADGAKSSRPTEVLVDALGRALRSSDIVAAEGDERLWVLASASAPLGSVILKHRLRSTLAAALRRAGLDDALTVSVASYPLDADRVEDLMGIALARLEEERSSLFRQLDLSPETPLAETTERLLERAHTAPGALVADAAEIILGELTCAPRERGLLYLAPGDPSAVVLDSLRVLGDQPLATEVFVAADPERLPGGRHVTVLPRPPGVPESSSWIVRYGEGPAYALVAGPPDESGQRPVFHTADASLVEHLSLRLRAEVGFGVRA